MFPSSIRDEFLSRDLEKKLLETFFYLMKENIFTYEELKRAPLPAILLMSKQLRKHNEREAREMKKKK